MLPTHLIPTTVVGSYPQPDWLVHRARIEKIVPRVRMHELWRLPAEVLDQAQDDATLLAIREMERAGIDIISDGEIRRESYSSHFATALDGMDLERPGRVKAAVGWTEVPRVVGRIQRTRPVVVGDMEFLRRNTTHPVKMTLPGPFTMSVQAEDEHYRDDEALAMDLAAAVNEEAHDLVRAGADVIQIDEPWVRNSPDAARRYAVKAINRALLGLKVPTIVHLCFGYAAVIGSRPKPNAYDFLEELTESSADQISIEAAQPKLDLGVLSALAPKKVVLGILDLSDPAIESAETVADRLRSALKFASADRIVAAPDCGMKYLPRATAFGKLKALVEGTAIVRREIS